MSHKLIHTIYLFLSLIFIFITACYHSNRPMYDWDMLPYSAIQYKLQGVPDSMLHEYVFQNVYNKQDSSVRKFLSRKPLERRALLEPDFFLQQLPFYTIKPLYNYAAYITTVVTGATPLQSLFTWSIIGYILLMCSVLYYMQLYYSGFVLLMLTIAIGLLSPVIETARMFTPDMFSTALLFVSFLFILRNDLSGYKKAYALLCISLLIRPENIIWIIVLPATLAYAEKTVRLHRIHYIVPCIALIIYSAIQYSFSGYGWKLTFQHSLLDLSKAPPEWRNIRLTPMEYLEVLWHQIHPYSLKLWSAVFISFLTYQVISRWEKEERKAWMILWQLNLIFFIIRFLAFPIPEDRYSVASLVLATLLLFRAIVPPKKLFHT